MDVLQFIKYVLIVILVVIIALSVSGCFSAWEDIIDEWAGDFVTNPDTGKEEAYYPNQTTGLKDRYVLNETSDYYDLVGYGYSYNSNTRRYEQVK